jgi:hypothetical protein
MFLFLIFIKFNNFRKYISLINFYYFFFYAYLDYYLFNLSSKFVPSFKYKPYYSFFKPFFYSDFIIVYNLSCSLTLVISYSFILVVPISYLKVYPNFCIISFFNFKNRLLFLY